MSRTGIARTRHIRHRSLSRMRRQKTAPNFYAAEALDLTGTGATTAFTAANATEIMTATAHGLVSGQGPFVLSNAGGALPAGLSATAQYWVDVIDANTFYWVTSKTARGAVNAVPISDDGTGTHSYALAAEVAADIYEINRRGVRPETIAAATDVDSL